MDLLVGGCREATQQVQDVGVGFESVAFGRLDECEEDGAGGACFFGADEEPVFHA